MSPASGPKPPNKLGLDEIIALIVTFAVMGTIAWVSVRPQPRQLWDRWLVTMTADESPEVSEEAEPTPSPEPEAIAPSERFAPRDRDEAAIAIAEDPPEPATELDTTADEIPPLAPVAAIPVLGNAIDPEPEAIASPSAAATAPGEFTDVPSDHWASSFINALSSRQIVAGFPDGGFYPNQPVTRAEFAVQLQQLFDREAEREPKEFTDVPADFWAKEGIDTVVARGFMGGYPGDVFRPEQPVRRVEVLVALANGLDLQTPEEAQQILQNAYDDAPAIDDWARNSVASASAGSLVVNYPDRQFLNPEQSATRAEVAAMLYQALITLGEAEELPSEYVVTPEDWE